MTPWRDIIQYIVDTAPVDDLKARLTVAALATRGLEQHGLAVLLVGGSAVDLYASGGLGTSESYPAHWSESRDVDTIVLYGLAAASAEARIEALRPFGFRPRGLPNAMDHPDIPYIIDFVGRGYPDDYSTYHEVELFIREWEELQLPRVRVVGPEDLLFDYMESGAHTHNQRDWTRALTIAAVMRDELDLGYLLGKAEWRLQAWGVPWLERVLRGEPLA